MTVTLTAVATVKLKAGANWNAAITDGNITTFINQAEAYLMAVCRVNWVSLYSTIDATFKLILEDAASSHAAMAMINYDMSGYTSRQEALTMLNVNYTRLTDAINQLKEKYTTDFIQGT